VNRDEEEIKIAENQFRFMQRRSTTKVIHLQPC